MEISTILVSFKQKIEDAVSMVPDMIAEEKLRAVQFWNVVSEKLQEIVNNSAADITALAFQLDKDKLPEYLDGSLGSLGAPPGVVSGFNGCGGMTSQLIASGGGAYVSPSLMKKYIGCGDTRSAAPVLAIQRPRPRSFGGCVGGATPVPLASPHAAPMLFSSTAKCSPMPFSGEAPLPVSVELRVRCIGEEENRGENEDDDREECNGGENREPGRRNQEALTITHVEEIAIADQEEEVKESSSPEGSMVHLMISADPVDTASNDSTSSLLTCSEASTDVSLDKVDKGSYPDTEDNANEENLEVHIRNEMKPYNCFDCESSFSSKGNLIVHRRRHTGEKPYVCVQCESRFSTKGNLKRHVKAHSGIKPWECTTCGGRFTEKKSLKVHMRRHTGERPYQCKLCSKKFSQSGILQSHMAMHLNQKAHLCELCGKSFRQKSQLRLHTQRHQGVRKFDCPHCPSKFLTKGDMCRHKRTHTGERPFECTLCRKTFTRQQSLNEHMNRHYGRKPYKCKYCRKGFAEMSACYKHIKSHEKSRDPGNNAKEDISENDHNDPQEESKLKEVITSKVQEEEDLYQEISNQENGKGICSKFQMLKDTVDGKCSSYMLDLKQDLSLGMEISDPS